MLTKVAQAVATPLRDSDYVGCRGGEEFVVLAANTALEGATRLAQRLRVVIDALAIRDYGRVSASFGVAVHRQSESSRDTLKRADLAMYAAKQGGRNRVETSAG